ncbi:MAG: SDR family NAD(P)-dependent oxidoreductase [Okeania sp. SIO2H7]|nr:SDR family NAD(P)-dependent oxidoreductase [Okeania sp. SIO2H7]
MNPIYQDLKEKHILITGGSNGIGEALTKTFAEQAAEVTILDKDYERGLKVAEECQQYHCKVNVYGIDLTDSEAF